MKEIILTGGVGCEISTDLVKGLLPEDHSPIHVKLSTLGGYVSDGITIHNLFRDYKGEKHLTISGIVASMGAYITTAFPKKNIKAHDNSIFMIHNAIGFSIGDHSAMEQEADLLKRMDKVISKALSSLSGKSIDEILELMGVGVNNEGTWYFGEEIVQEGFAGELITTGEDNEKSGAVAMAINSFRDFRMSYKKKYSDSEKVAAFLNAVDEKDLKEEVINVTKEQVLEGLKEHNVTVEEALQVIDPSIIEIAGSENVTKNIQAMKKKIEDNEEIVREAKLDSVFGKGTDVRAYADKVLDSFDDESIEAFKKDPLAVKLAAGAADETSEENKIVVHEGDKNKDTGIAVVDY